MKDFICDNCEKECDEVEVFEVESEESEDFTEDDAEYYTTLCSDCYLETLDPEPLAVLRYKNNGHTVEYMINEREDIVPTLRALRVNYTINNIDKVSNKEMFEKINVFSSSNLFLNEYYKEAIEEFKEESSLSFYMFSDDSFEYKAILSFNREIVTTSEILKAYEEFVSEIDYDKDNIYYDFVKIDAKKVYDIFMKNTSTLDEKDIPKDFNDFIDRYAVNDKDIVLIDSALA